MSFSLYIHIPFCEVKCGYCDFFSVPRGHEDFDLQKEYTSQLLKEIGQRAPEFSGRKVHSIFFGGGTPSLLDPQLMRLILKALSRYFSWTDETEITMEANPKTVSRERLTNFRSLGINRLSIGVQSFQENFLKAMGRIHSGDEAKKTVADARAAGFDNVSVDLIYSLPGETLAELCLDLKDLMALQTNHFSAYNLTIEAGTPFEKLHVTGKLVLPEEEEQRGMFDRVRQTALENGFVPYEISNFAKPGYECRHNLNYWNYGNYLGFGAGAVSQIHPHRRQNVRDLRRYLQGDWLQETEEISPETAMQEYMMMGLRKAEGVESKNLSAVFLGIAERLCHDGWLVHQNGYLHLTEKSIPLANEIIGKFFL